MLTLMIFQLVLLLTQLVILLAHIDTSTKPYKEPDYLSHAGRDMMWNRDKLYKD